MIKYVDCPYCAFRYKQKDDPNENEKVINAMAGHIQRKHPGKPKIERTKDLKVIIPPKSDEEAIKNKELRIKQLEAELDALNKK